MVDAELFKTASKAFAQKLINDPKLGTQGSQHLTALLQLLGR